MHQELSQMKQYQLHPSGCASQRSMHKRLLGWAKGIWLANQFRKTGAVIIGIQETRSHKDTDYVADGWLFLGACANNGDYGVDVWIDLRAVIAFREGTKVRLSREAVTVVFRHPRLMVVVIHGKVWGLCIICGHTLEGRESLAEPTGRGDRECTDKRRWKKYGSLMLTHA